uniref:putative bifunctional diguanylate cyclase/phosphodiesterase n=1 Tax=Thioalkalivibrio sp. ALE23 TaxID=1265495 RepID=UPI0003677391
LYYQPKISIASGEVIGMEALIRWQSPQRGFLNPGAFLPYIEGTSVTQDLDRHVLGLALRQIEAWSAQGIDVPISVNIGVDLLQSADFVPMIREMLSRHPSVAPDRIELEVLETGAIDDIQGISATLKEIRDLGVGLALDDFGTGYSSLAYLKRLPTDTLKIDRTFVRDMLEDPEDLNIIDGVISLSKAFHRTVIAEGVETREHGRVLFERGCSQGQGFGIARPMPAEEVPDWLTQWAQSESEGWRFEKLAAGQN